MNSCTLARSSSSRLVPLALACCALGGAFAGCSKSDTTRTDDAVKDAYHDSKDALSEGWSKVKSATFDKRDDFNSEARARLAKIEAQISTAKAEHADAEANASRKQAWDELKNSQADYRAKVNALGNASSETWESAKANVVSSWDHVAAAYDRARAK